MRPALRACRRTRTRHGWSRPTRPRRRRALRRRCSRCGTASRRCRSSRDAAARRTASSAIRSSSTASSRRSTPSGRHRLLDEHGLDFDHPHHVPRARGAPPQRHGHAVRRPPRAHADAPRRGRRARPRGASALEAPGSRVRPASAARRAGATSRASRTSATRGDSSSASATRSTSASAASARLGAASAARTRRSRCRSRAASVRPGMAMFTEDGGYDVVEAVERVPLDRRSTTSTSRARTTSSPAGLVTHNSIYGFRGADITQHPRLPGRLPRRPRRQARAELPLDADDPRRRQRGDRAQPRADGQGAVDRHRRGRPDQGPRARRRARRGAVRRRRDRAARRRGRLARRDRRLLPDQRAVAGARGHARARARSATRSSAARSSTSARRSRTRSRT